MYEYVLARPVRHPVVTMRRHLQISSSIQISFSVCGLSCQTFGVNSALKSEDDTGHEGSNEFYEWIEIDDLSVKLSALGFAAENLHE